MVIAASGVDRLVRAKVPVVMPKSAASVPVPLMTREALVLPVIWIAPPTSAALPPAAEPSLARTESMSSVSAISVALEVVAVMV